MKGTHTHTHTHTPASSKFTGGGDDWKKKKKKNNTQKLEARRYTLTLNRDVSVSGLDQAV